MTQQTTDCISGTGQAGTISDSARNNFILRLEQAESAAMMKFDKTIEAGYVRIRSNSPQELMRIVSGLIFAGFRSLAIKAGVVIVHMDEEYNNSGLWIGIGE